MNLKPGSKLGNYVVGKPLGSGGMGDVYQATDTKLDREVAIKVLPERLLHDATMRERFEREAKAVAALSHPNILSIFDFGTDGNTAYAVTELLEGQTLDQRLIEGSMPPRKAIQVACDIAEGLAAAHDQGIIHRDIKPANLFLMQDGRVKILDFGLAKSLLPDDDKTNALTMGDGTSPGTVLGTVGYMSPEQVRATEVDGRSDIFSLGAVLHEMLTGGRAFTRDSSVETMNAILREDPSSISGTGVQVPLSVERVIRRCLEKNPQERFQSPRDLAFALKNALAPTTDHDAAPLDPQTKKKGAFLPWLVAALALGALGVMMGRSLSGSGNSNETIGPPQVRTITSSGRDWSPAISPDGKLMAFVSDRDGQQRIWLKQLPTGAEVPLTDGRDAIPSFSSDGASIHFVRQEGANSTVYRVPVLGGSPRRILSDIIDAAWSPDGTELAVARDIESGVTYQMQLCDPDGNCKTIYEVGTRSGYGLAWSPNGKYLSTALVAPLLNHPTQDILVLDAATGEEFRKFRIPFSIGPPAWSLDGENILVARSTTLLGDLADPHGQILSYNLLSQMPKTLLHLGATTTNGGIGVVLAVESENSFYFDEIELQSALHSVSIPASTDKDGQVLLSSIRLDRQPAFSPDGTKIIFSSNRSLNLDLWLFDRTTEELIQITDDEAQDWDPAFTPDGNGILWSSNRSGQLEIWKANVDGTNAEQVSNDGVDAENPTQGAGRWVAYGSGNPANPGVWLIDPETKETRHVVEGIVGMPDMSPDGKHVFCLEISNAELKSIIRIADVETGEIVLKTDVLATNSVSGTTTGRGRWMPDGKSFVFVMREPEGLSLISQEFRPGENTDATRKRLVGPTTETEIESFCIHPNGQEIVTANRSARMVIKHAQNVQ